MKLESNNKSGLKIYGRLLGYLSGLWFYFGISFFGYLLFALSQAAAAIIVEYLPVAFGESAETNRFLDRFVQVEDTADLRYLLPLFLIIIALMRGAGAYLGGYYIAVVGRTLIHRLRKTYFSHLQDLPGTFFQGTQSGDLISIITFNTEQVMVASTEAIRIIVREGMTVILLFLWLIYQNWQLTLTFLIVLPFIGLVISLASKFLRRYSHRIQESMGTVAHIASESIRGFAEVKIYSAQEQERARFREQSLYNLTQSLKLSRVIELSTPIVQVLVFSSLALLFWIGLSPEYTTQMDSGKFLSYITAAAMIARPLRRLTAINVHIQKGVAAAQSLFEVYDLSPENDDGKLELGRAKGEIEFINLNFNYQGSESAVLSGINLQIKPGETLALVGRSGAGKTTLVNLITRMNLAPLNSFLLDGVPIESYKLQAIRRQIAIVSQQIVLFNSSVRDNIAYGELAQKSDQEVIEAAKNAQAWEFIQNLPDGIHSMVGENGVSLSGGQRQRITLARAFLKDAPILILDEATSALDNESEMQIQAALNRIMKDRTTIVIAHRLSTIEKADRIVVMDAGKIVEEGDHNQLLELGGVYTKLHSAGDVN